MDVYLNGHMVPHEQARVSIDDAGFQHAVGLFETMHAQHGQAFRLEQHLARLADSARQLGLARELDTRALSVAVSTTLDHNRLRQARVRLTLTPGNLSLLRPSSGGSGQQVPQPTVLVVASEPTIYDAAYFERGITVLIAPPTANPFNPLAGHKTLSYWGALRTLRQAAAVGAGEAICLNVTNHLASGTISNLFLVKNQALYTPFARGEEVEGALPAPVLPGITRAAVIELADAMHLPVHRQMLSVNDLLEADEIFLTNSSWQILPVTKVEKQPIAAGEVGDTTRRLREALLDLIESETLAASDEGPA